MYRRPGRLGWYASLDRSTRHISLDTDDEEQAKINLADLIHRRAAEGVAPKKGELGVVFVECAKRAKVNHTFEYADDVCRRLEHLDKWMLANGVVRPDKVTLAVVEQYKSDERQRGITDRTINRYLDVWKKAMKLAVDENLAAPRVLTYFRKLREPLVEPHQRGLTLDEIDRTLKAVDDERYLWLFRVVAGTGMRDDEVRHLEESWVKPAAIGVTPLPPDSCRCHPRGWTTKNFRYRLIPASADTVAAARSYAAIKHSMNLDSKKVWTELANARRAAGLDWEWSMHELRRAWASHMLAAGHKLQDISRWLGHADIKTTMRYLRVVEDEMPAPEDLPL
jgi:integrase